MKLREMYGTNKSLETDGKWCELDENIAFKIKRFGGSNKFRVQKITNRLMRPYQEQIKRGTLPEKKDRQLLVESFCEACLIDWRGVTETVDGKEEEIKYTHTEAVKLLLELDDLAQVLMDFSQKMTNYQDQEDLGNGSVTT